MDYYGLHDGLLWTKVWTKGEIFTKNVDCSMDCYGLSDGLLWTVSWTMWDYKVGLNWDYIWDHMGHQLGLVGLQMGLSESTSEIIPHTI